MRFVLLDRITHFDPPASAKGVKCVALSEDVFADHFPGHPVMPGSLLLEAMAQLGGALLEGANQQEGKNLHALLTMADRVRFRRMARPGDRLEIEAETLSRSEEGGRVKARVTMEGALAAEAELTFVFTPVRHPKILAWRQEQMKVWLDGSLEAP